MLGKQCYVKQLTLLKSLICFQQNNNNNNKPDLFRCSLVHLLKHCNTRTTCSRILYEIKMLYHPKFIKTYLSLITLSLSIN